MIRKLSCLLSLVIVSNSFAQTVKFSSNTPALGKSLSFEYHPTGGVLEKLSDVKCEVFMYYDRDGKGKMKVDLKKENGIYKGEFKPLDSAHLAVLVFSAGVTVDENPKGYFTKFYKNGVETPMSTFLEGHLHAYMGKDLFRIKLDLPRGLALYAKAFTLDPKLKSSYINNYLLALYTMDKAKGEKAITETIVAYQQDPTEYNLLKIPPLYAILGKKAQGDSVMASIKLKYPIGAYALSLENRSLSAIKDPYKREARLLEIIRDYKLDLNKKRDVERLNWFFDRVGQGYADIYEYDKSVFYFDKFEPKYIRAVYYHKIAQKNALGKTNLDFAERISKKAVDLIDSMKNEPLPRYTASMNERLVEIAELGSPYLVTYLTILGLLEKNEDALKKVEDAVQAYQFKNEELNTLYINILRKNGKNEEVLKYGAQFVKVGFDNTSIKEDIRAVYKGEAAFENYYGTLIEDAIVGQKTAFLKEMINVPAPNFTLTNLKGERVSLANLKGKVVVIDYWATWCSPCISSFPGMQKAVDKYKNDPNVVFLFINTWEKLAPVEREKIVRSWMTDNPKYTFNVLLDKRRSNNPEEYEVISDYHVGSIPTKFIIDTKGNIRFKKIGSSDVSETIVKELDLMIALAKEAR